MSELLKALAIALQILDAAEPLAKLVAEQRALLDKIVAGLTPEDRAALDSELVASRSRKEKIREQLESG